MTRAPSSRHVASRKSRVRVQDRKRHFVPQAQGQRRSPVLAILLLAGGGALLFGGLASSSLLSDGPAAGAGGISNMAIVLIVAGVVMGGLGLERMLRRPA